MKARFDELPTLEDLVGAGMDVGLAMSFRCHIEQWTPLRAWAFLLKRATNSFSKFDIDTVSQHIKNKVGDQPLAEVGQDG